MGVLGKIASRGDGEEDWRKQDEMDQERDITHRSKG